MFSRKNDWALKRTPENGGFLPAFGGFACLATVLLAFGLVFTGCDHGGGGGGQVFKTVTFLRNYDSNDTTVLDTESAEEGKSLGASMPQNPSRAGYNFRQWDTKADGSGTDFNSNTPVNDDINIYALWSLIPGPNQYMLNYNDDGGTGNIQPVYGKVGDTITLSDGTGLSRDGYTFAGWNTKADYSGGTHYDKGASWTFPAANTNLYAEWQCEITFYNGTTLYDTETALYGETLGKAKMPADPTPSDGSKFKYWNTVQGGGGDTFTAYTPVDSKFSTVYAVYKTNPSECDIIFNPNGGSGSVPDIDWNKNTNSPALPDGGALSRSGFTFKGWSISPQYCGAFYNTGDTIYTGSNDIIYLYAVWSGDGSDETHAIAITNDSELPDLYDPDKNFILANDITYDGPPLGDSANPYYNGVFNGNGHTIQVHINGVVILEGFAVCGLFPQVSYSGVVKNLRIINAQSDNPQGVHADFSNSGVSQAYAGVVTGVNFGTITNIICEAILTCGPMTGSGSEPQGINAGGIAGWNATSSMYGKTNYVYTRGDVDSSDGNDVNIGGVFGKCSYSIDHIVALNERLMNGGTNEFNGRISGNADSVIGCSKLYANSAMTANGSAMESGSDDTDAEKGADVSAAQFNTENWWTGTAGWEFYPEHTDSIWVWDSSVNLPSFAQQ